jgi:hypothetical protein
MKRVFQLTLLFVLFTAISASAQSLVGKWEGRVKMDEETLSQVTNHDGGNVESSIIFTLNEDGTAISETLVKSSIAMDEETTLIFTTRVESGLLWSLEGNKFTETTNGYCKFTVEDVKFEPSSFALELMIPSLKQQLQSQLDSQYSGDSAGVVRVCHVEFISDDEFTYCAGEVTSANGVDFDAPTIHFKRIVE